MIGWFGATSLDGSDGLGSDGSASQFVWPEKVKQVMHLVQLVLDKIHLLEIHNHYDCMNGCLVKCAANVDCIAGNV
jgi:hypothetical protein